MMNRPIHLGLELATSAQNHRASSTKVGAGGGKANRKSSSSSLLSSARNNVRDWFNGVAGRIQVAIRVSDDREIGEGNRRRKVFVEIERCVGVNSSSLLLGGSSKSSVAPFIIIKLNGKEVGRTPPVKVTDNQTCTWLDETYEFNVCDSCQTIQLQAWNMIMIGGQIERIGDFVGSVTIPIATLKDVVVDEIRDLDLELNRWDAGAAKDADAASSSDCCCCPDEPRATEGPLHCPGVESSETHHNADLVHVRSSSKWSVKRRRGSSFYARPESTNPQRGRYRVDNPYPFRRRDIREVTEDNAEGSFLSSTFFRAIGLIGAYLLLGVVGFSYVFESLTIRDSLYLSVVTFTTVGFGDFRPVSDGGKLFSCVFALTGIGMLGIALGYIGQNLIQAQVLALQMANRKSMSESSLEQSSQSEVVDGNAAPNSKAAAQDDASPAEFGGDSGKAAPAPLAAITNFLAHSTSRQLLLSFFPIAAMVLSGSLIVGRYEGWNWVDSIYWCVITGTSVGYGDYYPRSSAMRWFSVFYIPLAVGAFSAALGRIANIFVEDEIRKSNQKLLQREVTVEDLEAMNADGDDEVSILEFIEHMLKAMNKVDQTLLDELHSQFDKLDADGSGGLEQDDLVILTERKLSDRRKIILEKYRNALLRRRGSTFGRISAQLAKPVSPELSCKKQAS